MDPAQWRGAPVGWYPDPTHRAPLRHWSGQDWGAWVGDGHAVWHDAAPVRRHLTRADLHELVFVEEVFLPEARSRGFLSETQLAGLTAVISDLAREARQDSAAPQPATAPRATAPEPVAWPVEPPRTQTAAPPADRQTGSEGTWARPVVVREPSASAQRWARIRTATGSDLGVHGLAYLGVLLLFVGVFGLVVFAFADVTPSLRPVAELASAAVPFIAARLLLRHGAVVVGRALEAVGGFLLPVMLITSVLDGFPVPPDLHGTALAVALTGACAVTGAGYAVWSRYDVASGLRLVAAPMLWFAVAMATLGVGRPIPGGKDVAVPSSAQLAAASVALVLTLLAARRWPSARLAEPARTAAVPGTVVLAVLALLTWSAEGSPTGPVIVTGVLLLVVLALLRPAVPDAVADVVAPVWWALVTLALLTHLAPAPAVALAAGGFLVLLDVATRRAVPRPTGARPAVVLPALGLLACLVAVWADPRWAAATLAVVAAWAIARRTAPYAVDGSSGALDVVAAALPVAALVAFGLATDLTTGLVAATATVAAATLPAMHPVLARGDVDRFWRRWWIGAVPVVALWALLAWDLATLPAERWTVIGSVLVLAVLGTVGPTSPVARPWVIAGLAVTAWLMGCVAADIADVTRGVLLGVVALAVVGAAHRSRPAADRTPVEGAHPGRAAASLGLTGHVVAAVSLGLAGPRWGLVTVVALATAGLALTAGRDDRDRSPVGELLAAAGSVLRHLPWALTALGLPVTVWLVLDAAGTLPLDDPWALAVPMGTAVVYAAAARLPLSPRLVTTMVGGSFVAALLALLGTTASRELWTAVVGLACLIAAVLLLPGSRRAAPMVWTAWAAVTPFVGLLAWQTVPWFDALGRLTAAATTLVVVGGTLLVGAAAADLWHRPWVPTPAPRHAWLVAPAFLGALDVCLGLLAVTGPVPGPAAGLLTLFAGTVLLLVGVLARAGVLGAGATLLAWVGTWQLAGPALDARPWVSVAVAAGLLVAGEALYRLTPDRGAWSRWDVPLLVAAGPVALTGLAVAVGGPAHAITFVLIGLEVLTVALRLHRRRALAEVLGWSATILVLVGSGVAGAGWLALALLFLAVAHTGLALRASGDVRVVRQVTGVLAALASWVAALDWFAWSAQHSVDATAAGAGAVTLLVAGLAWLRRTDRTWLVDRSWLHVWGGAAVLVTAVAALTSERSEVVSGAAVEPSGWVLLGLLGVVLGLVAATGALRLPWLRDLAAAVVLAGLMMSFQVGDAAPATQLTVLAAVAAVLAAGTLALSFLSPGSPLARPCAELGGGAAVVAVLTGLVPAPDIGLLAPALAAVTVQAAAIGVAQRSVGLQMLAPALACTSWVLFVKAAIDGGPSWYTVAVGLALLAITAVWRRDRRARGRDAAGPEVVALELAAIAFLVGASFTQAVTQSIVHALVAAGFGVAVAGWGVLTRVRRRVATGAVVVLTALVVLVAVPLVALLPAWGGAGLWLLIAGVGLLAVLIATMIERGRTAVRTTIGRVSSLTAGWE
ncbi:hypothetical protein [Cellulomonas sp. KRMCY2]|uniref:hypothetical protein n=1 Tax=Cellulomonas sp. KRMCY2 TaxID=1304865 RepID=UPI00045E7955|nr:hypothetical protein [Cellulomonas sp. KRMCY2]